LLSVLEDASKRWCWRTPWDQGSCSPVAIDLVVETLARELVDDFGDVQVQLIPLGKTMRTTAIHDTFTLSCSRYMSPWPSTPMGTCSFRTPTCIHSIHMVRQRLVKREYRSSSERLTWASDGHRAWRGVTSVGCAPP
jgi:hypothetical protein